MAGGREYSCRCGMCNRVAPGYSPPGFRTVSLDVRSAKNIQQYTDSVFCCSDICEAQWLMQSTTKRIEELMGEEYGRKSASQGASQRAEKPADDTQG